MNCFACGAAAFHRHHGGEPSCKSCSAFFRRCIAHKKMFTCRRQKEKCLARALNAHGCQRCRLHRCIEAGMDVSSIPFADVPSHLSGDLLQRILNAWNANYLARVCALHAHGGAAAVRYFDHEKTIETCGVALRAEFGVMGEFMRNNRLHGLGASEALFSSTWIALQMVYRTFRSAGFNQRRVCFPDNSFLPCNEVSLFHYYNSMGILMAPDIVARQKCSQGIEMLLATMNAARRLAALRLDELEFAVCAFILLLKFAAQLSSREVAREMQETLNRMFRELQLEYARGLKDAALRFGDLISAMDVIMDVKNEVDALFTVLALHERPHVNFFAAKKVEN